jgi:hypothetical protein
MGKLEAPEGWAWRFELLLPGGEWAAPFMLPGCASSFKCTGYPALRAILAKIAGFVLLLLGWPSTRRLYPASTRRRP